MSLNPVYINFASKMELQKLKGVGPAVADNIKAYLSASGNFLGPEDLAQVRNLKLNKEEIERISFHTNPKYSFLHTTKSQSEGSTSVGDVSENSPSPAVHETADEEVFTDQGIGPGDTPHGNPQSERTGSEEIMNDALRGLITKKNKEKSQSQSLRPKEFELPPPLKDPSDQSYVTGARSVNNEQKPVVGAGIDTFEQKHAVIAGMEGGYLNTQMLNTSVAPPIQTSCSPVPQMFPPTTVSAPYGGMQPQWGMQYSPGSSTMMPPYGMAPWGPYPYPYYPPQPYGHPIMSLPQTKGVFVPSVSAVKSEPFNMFPQLVPMGHR